MKPEAEDQPRHWMWDADEAVTVETALAEGKHTFYKYATKNGVHFITPTFDMRLMYAKTLHRNPLMLWAY